MSIGRVIVYGGKGALGSACVTLFKSKNWVSIFSLFLLYGWCGGL